MEVGMQRAVGEPVSGEQLPTPHASTTPCGHVLLALDAFFASYTDALPALTRVDLRRIVFRLDAYAREVDDDASRKA
jgi:hypothetical protein